MAVVLDTSIIVAFMVADEADHGAVRSWIDRLDDDLVTTPLALAEMDHLVTARGGGPAAARLWADFERGAYQVRWWADALAETLKVARAQKRIGLVDASLVALAERLSTTNVATLDHRHFRTLTTSAGPLDLLGEMTGVGRYEGAVQHASPMKITKQVSLVIDLDWLIRAKRAAGRPKDLEVLAELEILRDLAGDGRF